MAEVLNEIEEAKPRRFSHYPEYKNSGVEWLGEIPAHWDTPRMWQISRAVSGGTPSKEQQEYWDGDIPWVTPKDMKRRFIDSSEDRITERAIEESGMRLLPPPVMLIVVRGMILAHSFPVAITTVPVTINQDMKALTFEDTIDPLFMAWLFEGVGRSVRAAIVEEAAHGTRAIRMDEWRSVIVPVPPVSEQRAITAFLDHETAKIDALVGKKEKLIKLLREKRTALITRAATNGLDPNVPRKDSGVEWLGEIPAHWDTSRMWQISRVVSGGTPSKEQQEYWDGDIPWVTPKDMKRHFIDSSEDRITERAIEESGMRLLPPPVMLIVVRGMILAHSFPVAITTVPVTINQDMKALTFKDTIDSLFMVWLFEGIGRSVRAAIVEEAAHGTRAIRMDEWRSVIVPVPPVSEQRAITAFLGRHTKEIDTLIGKVSEAIDRLKEFRTALISAAVTGKIDVREETT